jgi:hypothetical protein
MLGAKAQGKFRGKAALSAGRLKKIAAEVLEQAPLILSDAGKAPSPKIKGGQPKWLMTRAQWTDAENATATLFAVSDGDGEGRVQFDLTELCGGTSPSKKTIRSENGVFWAHFVRDETDHFTKTGSGQTQGKLKQTCCLLAAL